MNEGMELTSTMATCGVHIDEQATGICERCGSYLCSLCRSTIVEGQCQACAIRTGRERIPLDRDSFSIGGVLSIAFERWADEWLKISAATGIFLVTYFGVALGLGAGTAWLIGPEDQVASALLDWVKPMLIWLQAWVLMLGLHNLCIDVLEGRPARIGRLFSGVPKVGLAFLQMMSALFYVGIPYGLGLVGIGLLVAVAGNWAGLVMIVFGPILFAVVTRLWVGLSFMQMELAQVDRVGPVEAMVRSHHLAKGYRWQVLAIATIAMLIAAVGFLACGIGAIVSFGLGNFIVCTAYRVLREGADLPPVSGMTLAEIAGQRPGDPPPRSSGKVDGE